jgi:hypothetical protein
MLHRPTLAFPSQSFGIVRPVSATREEPSIHEDFKTDGGHMNSVGNIADPDPASISDTVRPLATANAIGIRHDASIILSERN